MSGLQINDLDNFSHLLTGYVGSVSFLEQVYDSVKQLKEKNPKLVYGMKCAIELKQNFNFVKTNLQNGFQKIFCLNYQ